MLLYLQSLQVITVFVWPKLACFIQKVVSLLARFPALFVLLSTLLTLASF